MNDGRCPYCGAQSRDRTCRSHDDLSPLDPLSRPASGSRDGFYAECPDCGYDEANCACDENTADDRWLEAEDARERLREEDRYLYGI